MMHRNISEVRFTVSFLALLLVVFLSACSSAPVKPTVVPSQNTPVIATPPPAVTPAVAPVVIPQAVSTPEVVTPPVKPAPTPVVPKAATGTFHERVSYDTPESSENVDFVFTVDSGVVTNLALNSTPQESASRKYQTKFMNAITGQVVGKKITAIGSFDRVGGASLTTPAFNQAVAKLKAQS